MSYVKATLRDGSTVAGEVWTWRPKEGWFELIGDDPTPVRLDDVQSGTITSRFSIKGEETRDLLEHAKQDGYLSKGG